MRGRPIFAGVHGGEVGCGTRYTLKIRRDPEMKIDATKLSNVIILLFKVLESPQLHAT